MTRAMLLAAMLLVACSADTPRTQVMVVVSADEEVRADTARLRVVIRSGAAFDELRLEQTIGGDGRPLRWPVRIALVPQGGDASRVFDVEVEALTSTNARSGIVRARSGYVPHRTKELALLLEDCCRAVECSAEESCRGCTCGSKDVPPDSLPDLPDAPHDASVRRDAGPNDTGVADVGVDDGGPTPSDAGPPDAALDAVTLNFPTPSDPRVATADSYWRAGDYVEGRRDTALSSATRADIALVVSRTVSCDFVEMRMRINDVAVGTFAIGTGQTAVRTTFDFPPVAGPTFVLRYETTRQLAMSCGSVLFDELESTVRLLR